MEFDSLSAYSGAASVSVPAQPVAVRVQNRDTEVQPELAETQPEVAVELPASNQRVENGNQDKLLARERNDQNNQESVLAKAIESANKKLGGTNYGFQYSVHEKTKLVMIKVVNSETKETVREVPPQKHLDAIAKMWELAGILVDERR